MSWRTIRIDLCIYDFVSKRNGAPRGAIEAHLAREGIAPHETTNGLKVGVLSGDLVRHIRSFAGNDYHIYFVAASGADTDFIMRGIIKDASIVAKSGIGRIGEIYVRRILLNARDFSSVTQLRNLGSVEGLGPWTIDIRALYDGIVDVAVQVKNCRTTFYGDNVCFAQLAIVALNKGMFPMFVAPFIDSRTIALCDEIGIPTISLGRQVFPKELNSSDREALYRSRDDLRVGFIDESRYRPGRSKMDFFGHVARADDKAYLVRTMRNWENNRPKLRKLIDSGKINEKLSLFIA